MNKQRISYLYQRYLDNTLHPEERKELYSILTDPQWDEKLKDVLSESYYDLQMEQVIDMRADRSNKIFDFIVAQPRTQIKKRRMWPRIAAAASIILCLSIGGYFIIHKKEPQQTAQNKPVKNDLLPGGNKAYLTISNGKRIALTGASNGQIAQQAGVTITKTTDGQLVYQTLAQLPPPTSRELEYNTIETPKGGQYQVILPDGSRVWLNAASSLRYPVQFSTNERKVELNGEAYFEVTHDPAKPFRVASTNQVVEVLGTHFNISSYTDEQATLTTLLEGSVKINNNTILTPGEQAKLAKTGAVIVKAVDTEEAIAWKKGYFTFSNESLESIMRKVCRWYNTDVIFKNESLKQITFSGTISKMDKVSKVLRRLELTNEVAFKVENNQIIASAAIYPIN